MQLDQNSLSSRLRDRDGRGGGGAPVRRGDDEIKVDLRAWNEKLLLLDKNGQVLPKSDHDAILALLKEVSTAPNEQQFRDLRQRLEIWLTRNAGRIVSDDLIGGDRVDLYSGLTPPPIPPRTGAQAGMSEVPDRRPSRAASDDANQDAVPDNVKPESATRFRDLGLWGGLLGAGLSGTAVFGLGLKLSTIFASNPTLELGSRVVAGGWGIMVALSVFSIVERLAVNEQYRRFLAMFAQRLDVVLQKYSEPSLILPHIKPLYENMLTTVEEKQLLNKTLPKFLSNPLKKLFRPFIGGPGPGSLVREFNDIYEQVRWYPESEATVRRSANDNNFMGDVEALNAGIAAIGKMCDRLKRQGPKWMPWKNYTSGQRLLLWRRDEIGWDLAERLKIVGEFIVHIKHLDELWGSTSSESEKAFIRGQVSSELKSLQKAKEGEGGPPIQDLMFRWRFPVTAFLHRTTLYKRMNLAGWVFKSFDFKHLIGSAFSVLAKGTVGALAIGYGFHKAIQGLNWLANHTWFINKLPDFGVTFDPNFYAGLQNSWMAAAVLVGFVGGWKLVNAAAAAWKPLELYVRNKWENSAAWRKKPTGQKFRDIGGKFKNLFEDEAEPN